MLFVIIASTTGCARSLDSPAESTALLQRHSLTENADARERLVSACSTLGPMQEKKSALEQHIAVFGESGSGKTVLVPSFYGAAQEASFLKQSLYRVVAEDIGQGARLNRNYLGMRDEARAPDLTRFAATSYAFSIKLKDPPNQKASKAQPFHALRLVWHDYPGDWFEQGASGEEARRRVDTFRSLLGSDVALLLVDGQRLLDHAGDEERYLRLRSGRV